MTSWENIGLWYQNLVGAEGHFYHRTVIMPGILRLLNLGAYKDTPHILDLACGQGIAARHLPPSAHYTGVDASASLVKHAREQATQAHHQFVVADVTGKLPLPARQFSHALIVLALQNIAAPEKALRNAASKLQQNGHLILVLNHPCFRIPRQSAWGVDADRQLQYRRVDRYMSPLEIPIQAHPSQGKASVTTWSFHHSLSDYIKWLTEAGFVVDALEEWVSPKMSEGKRARMENRARNEIPLFMAIRARLMR
jgi:ubiquinone/menaquinone biosynthesis C-methylase UbiE